MPASGSRILVDASVRSAASARYQRMGASTKCGTAAHAGDIETWPGTARRSGQASWKPAAASVRVAGWRSNALSSTHKDTEGASRGGSQACVRDRCARPSRSRCSAPLPTGPDAPRARHGGTAAGKKPSPPREIPVAQSSGGPRGRPRARRPHPTNELLAGLRKWGSTTRCRWKRPPATLQSTEDQARARRQFRSPIVGPDRCLRRSTRPGFEAGGGAVWRPSLRDAPAAPGSASPPSTGRNQNSGF